MIAGVTIRPCRLDECSIVLDLWKEAGTIPAVTDDPGVLNCLIQNADTMLLIAEYQNALVGTVIAAWDGWRGNIYRLAVLLTYRRQGIGRLLVKGAEDFLLGKGAQRISVLVANEEPLAVFFWDALIDAGYNQDLRIVRYAKTL